MKEQAPFERKHVLLCSHTAIFVVARVAALLVMKAVRELVGVVVVADLNGPSSSRVSKCSRGNGGSSAGSSNCSSGATFVLLASNCSPSKAHTLRFYMKIVPNLKYPVRPEEVWRDLDSGRLGKACGS